MKNANYMTSLVMFIAVLICSLPVYADILSETALSREALLENAIKAGQLEDMRELIGKGGMNVNQPFANGIYPVHGAIMSNQPEALALLVDSGANVNVVERTTGATPLHFAAIYGRENLAKFLLDKGAQVDAKMPLNITPLLVAAQFKHTPVVELLLTRKANINQTDEEGFSALHFAAKNGDEVTATLLLHQGINATLKDKTNNATAFMIATEQNDANMMRLLKPK